MSKDVFTIDLGTFLDSTPKIISCFCQNWEIYDALLRRRFYIYRIDKNTWKGSRYGVKVDWKLEHFTEDYSSGDFIFLGRAFLLGFTASAVVKIDYERLSYHRVYVHGFFEIERKGVLKFISAKKREAARQIASEVIRGGEQTSEMLLNDFDGSLELLNPEEKSFLLSQKSWLLAKDDEGSYEKDAVISMLNQLEKKYAADLLKDIEASVHIVDIHPALAMVNNRKIAEKVLRKIMIVEGLSLSNTMTAGYLLDKAVKDIPSVFPFKIVKHLRLICDLGGLAAHDETDEEEMKQDALISTLCTGKVLEWYFDNNPKESLDTRTVENTQKDEP